jgi:hypothetical protein
MSKQSQEATPKGHSAGISGCIVTCTLAYTSTSLTPIDILLPRLVVAPSMILERRNLGPGGHRSSNHTVSIHQVSRVQSALIDRCAARAPLFVRNWGFECKRTGIPGFWTDCGRTLSVPLEL